ncbi:tetratricopeptide repeat protein [Phaeospirillum tilakii]|uniref:protein O-GlcNAc transferase n=1 Tax=Phaeospirillum tilakii TaxID=741673 RepID=A0ABW5C8U9_9PROT
MTRDVLTPTLLQSMARTLSLMDLIKSAETLKATGQTDSIVTLYATWVEHNADHPLLYAALFNYAVILTELGRIDTARDCLERAVALNPDFLPAAINLGRVYEIQGATAVAVVQWSSVLQKLALLNGGAVTHKITALNQIARTLETAAQDDSAEEMLRQSLEIDPSQREVAQHYIALRQRQCEWPVMVPWERVGHDTLMRGLSPLSAAALADDPLLHLAVAAHYNKVDVGDPQAPITAWPRAAAHQGPLRIGYLSSDLREHAVGQLMAEVPVLHDRARVELFAYYCGPHSSDPMHDAFKTAFDHWLDINALDDATVARRMVEDGIQILVDLNGYTREARHRLLALRPAPVIVNWLGYPGTLASPYHHYLIADAWIIPPEDEIHYSEKVVRLPCYQPNNRQRRAAPHRPGRAELGLPEQGLVYCCFNGSHKITRFMFERWLLILSQVPDSVLWLLGGSEGAQQRLRDHAAAHGIDPARLVFADKRVNAEHLARYPAADLFLDTSPYGAHTTASDALWMGVPVLTLAGRSFAARVCGSLVRAAGLPELVCDDATAYVEQAIALGRDRARLQALRDRLVAGRDQCVLFDTPALVAALEARYHEMWADCQAGRLPRPDLANLDVYLEIGAATHYDETDLQTVEDYHGWWRDRLRRRHRVRPIAADARLFPPSLAAEA